MTTRFYTAALALGLATAAAAQPATAQPATTQTAATQAAAPARQVAVLVRIPLPTAVPRAALPALFAKAVPQYERVPGLVRKYFTVSDDNRFGGVYLFRDRASASAWFGPEWHKRVIATYGTDGEVVFFDAPVVIEGRNP